MSKFYTFQPVLVRCLPTEVWNTAFFDSEWNVSSTGVVYRMVGGACYSQCIPYEGNEKYIHTTDTPEPEWKPEPGEFIEVSDYLHQEHWHTARFVGMDSQGMFLCKSLGLEEFVPLVAWRHARKLQEPQKEAEDNPESSEWKPTPGELVAVRDCDAAGWCIRRFKELLTDGTYVCLTWNDPDKTTMWNQCVSIDYLKKLEHPHKDCKHCIPSEVESEDTQVDSGWVPKPGELIEVSNTGATDTWVKAKFIEMEDQQYVCSVNLGVHLRLLWPYVRKLQEPQKSSEAKPERSEWKPEPGEIVAVHNRYVGEWELGRFSHMCEDQYVCSGLLEYKEYTRKWDVCRSLKCFIK